MPNICNYTYWNVLLERVIRGLFSFFFAVFCYLTLGIMKGSLTDEGISYGYASFNE